MVDHSITYTKLHSKGEPNWLHYNKKNAISTGGKYVAVPKIVIDFPMTYMKLDSKGEPNRSSG